MRILWLSLVAVAGLLVGFASGADWPVTLIGMLFLVVLIGAGIQRVPEGHVAIIERLNRFARTSGPGLIWVTPGLERIARVAYVRLRPERFSVNGIRSEEQIPLDFSVMISYRIDFGVAERLRSEVAYYSPGQWRDLVASSLEAVLTSIVRAYPVFDIIGREEHTWSDMQARVRQRLEESLNQWAVALDADQGVVLHNVQLPSKLKEALDKAVSAGIESKTSMAILKTILRTDPEVSEPVLLDLMQALRDRDASQTVILPSGRKHSSRGQNADRLESTGESSTLSADDELKRGTLIIRDIVPRSEEAENRE